jgi:hypothetical protein
MTMPHLTIRPFEVHVPDEAWPTFSGTSRPRAGKDLVADRSQGVQLATIQDLVTCWGTGYDWRTCEAKLNALPQFKTEIVSALFRGYAEIGNDSPFAPVFAFTNISVPQRARNLTLTRQLLAKAGVPNGFAAHMATETTQEIPHLAQIVATSAKEIGVDITLTVETPTKYYGQATFGNSDWLDGEISLVDYGARSVPSVLLEAPLQTINAKTGQGAWNAARFNNPAYDMLSKQYIAALDLSWQRRIAGQIETWLLDETPVFYPALTTSPSPPPRTSPSSTRPEQVISSSTMPGLRNATRPAPDGDVTMPDHDRLDIAEIIDVETYPITEPGRPGSRVVERCRAALAEDGACQLDGFMRPAATQAVLAEAEMLSGKLFRTDATHNAYFTEVTAGLTGEDPRAVRVHSSKRALGFNHSGASSPLRILYEWDGLVTFLKDVLELPDLYRDADPAGACSVMFYDEGDELGWHFDNSEFAVTLMLQQCLEGGEFEYVPGIRTAEDENFAGVGAVLKGDRGPVRCLHAAPGALTLFRGRYSLHRVTPVRGAMRRVNAVLAYASTPGHRLTPLNRRLFYGADEDEPPGERSA